MSETNPDFRTEISRHESCLNTLNEFLKYATIEQDLYDTFEKSRQLSIESNQPNFAINCQPIPSLTTMIKQSKQHFQFMTTNTSPSYSLPTQRCFFK
ncbi:unnamed protein product [Rotaria sordida]|uniref:Uncharacterized protein n=3 Tax=Rotaria sordida TaxID=392033 RepID=A0A814TUI9_9BILA|nr:unnamed protein product [Rotaria sordida]CAF1164595.1 unnamed protein product [Rotaria sordida]CAF1167187.1 unnamed protein product [Rotaria sordida]CAF1416095.1 unnamed protein product [Rotaria sordida]CAF4130023.1 unnamed protein product [Rotaria sordida]